MLHLQQLNVALLGKVKKKKELRNVKLVRTKEFSGCTKGVKKKKKKSKAYSGHSGRLYESSTSLQMLVCAVKSITIS